ncbi:hypothetical protein [Actinomyces culturomici]|uniref:hypothetical protein n=1 Tax=Actinomyces culturomici TaxID=1926276 RepID=UPI000E1FFB57|nr:hypothetical protein [Actinomyces culturomici]
MSSESVDELDDPDADWVSDPDAFDGDVCEQAPSDAARTRAARALSPRVEAFKGELLVRGTGAGPD